MHPIHVSVTEIQYNSKTKKTEVALKVFSDDMELAIEQMQGKKVNLSNVANDLQLQNLIETYSSKHFAIIDSKSQKVALCYIGMETDHESLWIYAETLKPVRSISFTVFKASLSFDGIFGSIFRLKTNILLIPLRATSKWFETTSTVLNLSE